MAEGINDKMQQLIQDAPPWYKVPSLIRLYFFLIAPLITSTAWGFDLSMTNGLQSVNEFMDNFGNPKGATLGLFGAAQSVGGIVACIIGGPLSDRFGRRILCSFGAALVVGMAIMQTFSTNFHMFTGGKLLLGLGSNLQQVAAPVLVTELAHPKQRVALSSLYNTTIFIGLIIGSWVTFSTFSMNSQWAWKLPCILQIMLPSYQTFMIWLCPESPRWLASKGRIQEARDILVKYHGNGVETELVEFELREILAGIEADKTSMKFKDFKKILGSKANRHRLWLCVWSAVGSQSLGSGFVSNYLPLILDQIGMTSQRDKTLMNGIINIFNWVVSMAAAFVIPRIGRRTMFLGATGSMSVFFIVWTALTAQYNSSPSPSSGLGIGVIVMIFLSGACTSMCWVPLVVAYPLETVTTKQRGIFFAVTMLSINITAFATSYINPVGLDSLGWRYYIPQCIWNVIVFLVIYFTWVETRGLTLEEIATLFDDKEEFSNCISVVDAQLDEKAMVAIGHDEKA